jgi:hypothetical protein
MGKKGMSPAERSVVERTTYAVGHIYDIGGVNVLCVERPEVVCPQDACIGCYFCQEKKTCPPSQCSAMGRTDGRNVWFVKVSNE